MKNKILLLTTIYPSPDMTLLNGTSVCHYFAKEWVKLDYEVKVVFNYPIYARAVHKMADFLGKRVASIGQSYFITKRIDDRMQYNMDGVSVLRVPLYKWIPKVAVKLAAINRQIDVITAYLKEENFEPDFIVAHFCYPHLEMVTRLKEHYQAKATIVNHIQSLPLRKYIGSNYPDLLKKIDMWGYRSASIKSDFEAQFGVQSSSFMCYSGVPRDYIISGMKNFPDTISKFVYVGSLITRKQPLAVIQGIATAQSINDFQLAYVGEGIERQAIEKFVASQKLSSSVALLGNLKRAQVLQKLDDAECFVMISKGETFGLVYLEAMARGLLTIASKGEGMEGIIIDGENGFFCEAGNANQLASIIDHINTLSTSERKRISQNAVNTARKYTDEAVAKTYLNAII